MLNSLATAPLSVLKKALDDRFKDSEVPWHTLQLETISMEVGEVFSDLLKDKLAVLGLLLLDSRLFYEDVMFFLHAVHVINNSTSDFNVVPIPTSLEVAFAVASVHELVPGEFSEAIKITAVHILTQEGYSEVLPPFDFIGVKKEDLVPGQTEQDTKNKIKAIALYLKDMSKWPR